MGLNDGNCAVLSDMYLENENRADYLAKDVVNPRALSYSQRKSVKKAILWLLSKASHTVDEIADHFDLSPELVNFLIKEFLQSGMLVMDTDQARYCVGH